MLIVPFVIGIKSVSAVKLTAIDGTVITDENRSLYMCKNPYGDMIFKENLEYDNTKISLFCEFKDEEKAMDNFISQNHDILSYIEKKYKLKPLSSDNWKKYKEYNRQTLSENNIDKNLLEQAEEARNFFGLYEDKYRNVEITSIVNKLQKEKSTFKINNLIGKLNGITPYYSEQVELHTGYGEESRMLVAFRWLFITITIILSAIGIRKLVKNKRLRQAFIFSVTLVFFTVLNVLGIVFTEKLILFQRLISSRYYPLNAFIVIFGASLLAIIILTYLIYKVLGNPQKLHSKEKKKTSIKKQILNGISLSIFVTIINNNLWLEGHLNKSIYFQDFIAMLVVFLLLITIFTAICVIGVSKNKDLNEYLKLISYSELIIVPLILIGWYFFSFKSRITYESAIVSYACEDVIRILNVALPLIFYLRLRNKKVKRVRCSK